MSKPVAAVKPASNKPVIEAASVHPQPAAEQAAPAKTDVAALFSQANSTSQYEIEDGIPFPSKRIGVKGVSAYPFAKLEIGQNFFVGVSDKIKEPWKTLTSMASRIGRDLHPKKFMTARDKKNGVDGVRIWRTADATTDLAPPRKRKTKEVETITKEDIGEVVVNDNTAVSE